MVVYSRYMAPIAELVSRVGKIKETVSFTGDVKVTANNPTTEAKLSVHTDDGQQKLEGLIASHAGENNGSHMVLISDNNGFVSYEHYTPVKKITLPADTKISVARSPESQPAEE